ERRGRERPAALPREACGDTSGRPARRYRPGAPESVRPPEIAAGRRPAPGLWDSAGWLPCADISDRWFPGHAARWAGGAAVEWALPAGPAPPSQPPSPLETAAGQSRLRRGWPPDRTRPPPG